MNHYGRQAQELWAARRSPVGMPEETFFTTLGETIDQRVVSIQTALERSLPASTSYLGLVAELGAIRAQAIEIAMYELVYSAIAPESPAELQEEFDDRPSPAAAAALLDRLESELAEGAIGQAEASERRAELEAREALTFEQWQTLRAWTQTEWAQAHGWTLERLLHRDGEIVPLLAATL